jgi:hypothetical protein
MPRRYELVVVDGPDRGRRFPVDTGGYRVFGRQGDGSEATLSVTLEGDRVLDAEQQGIVDGMRKTPGAGAGTRTRFKKRGPDVLLKDGAISRTHAAVFVDVEGASVADLMSTNGTKVNGVLAQDADLVVGDVLQIGQTRLKLEEA